METAKSEIAIFNTALTKPEIVKVGQNLKYDINILRWYDKEVTGAMFDTMIAHYLLEPDIVTNWTTCLKLISPTRWSPLRSS